MTEVNLRFAGGIGDKKAAEKHNEKLINRLRQCTRVDFIRGTVTQYKPVNRLIFFEKVSFYLLKYTFINVYYH